MSTVRRPSPTTGLLVGLLITLVAVVIDSWYMTRQISGLRTLQTDLADRNRRDSLQLLRIQNNLNALGLGMRDMLDNDEPYPLTAWVSQFERIRGDLADALEREAQVAVGDRTPEQRQYLTQSVSQFWDAVDRMFALARDGRPQDGAPPKDPSTRAAMSLPERTAGPAPRDCQLPTGASARRPWWPTAPRQTGLPKRFAPRSRRRSP